jgi:hypothetical protein
VAEHRRAADKGADERALHLRGEERRDESLGDVQEDDDRTKARAEAAPDVRGADVPAAELADVATLERPDEPVPEREAAGQVTGDEESCGRYLRSIW